MAQQTTVQQFINEINRRVAILRIEPCGIVRDTMIDNLLIDSDGYLEMEKEQMIEFAEEYNMYLLKCKKGVRGSIVEMDAEQYYNDTYKTQTK